MKRLSGKIGAVLALLLSLALLASCTVAAGAGKPDPTATIPLIAVLVTPPASAGLTANPLAAKAPAQPINSGNVDIAPPPAPTATLGPYDVSVSIQYTVTLDGKVKDADPNIIRAARQAIFDYDAGNAHHAHYQGYDVSYDILIFEIDQKDASTWEVRFHEKQTGDAGYPDGYSFATVVKQKSGSYVGSIINPGGPMIRGDETY